MRTSALRVVCAMTKKSHGNWVASHLSYKAYLFVNSWYTI